MMNAEFIMEEALRVRFEEGKEDGKIEGEKSAIESVLEMIKAGTGINDLVKILEQRIIQ
jgi:hypothetical protein